MSDSTLRRIHSIADFRRAARRTLPRMVFDYVDGAAGTESTARANLAAFERVRLIPTGPVDISNRSTATTLFGKPMAMPLIIGPTGLASAFWPKGEAQLARAAAQAGIPFVLANGSSVSLREARLAGNPRTWFQLYMPPQRELALDWLRAVKEEQFEVVELTVDTAVPGLRNRDMQNVFSMPFFWSTRKVLDIMTRPRWALRMAPHGMPLPHLAVGPRVKAATQSDANKVRLSAALSWDDVKWVRDHWDGKLVIKGLTDVRQARHALTAGVDGIVVSNHGGRQMDGGVATLDVLPQFVAELGKRMPILIDSGFRTGSDIAKALALGATAVQIGRPTIYALAVGGQAGVERALALLKNEFDVAMALCGVCRPEDFGPDSVCRI